MITTRQILSKIQEISRNYFSGRPPIDVAGLTRELQVPREQVIPGLKELEAKKLISFYSTQEAIKLTPEGAQHQNDNNAP